MVDLLKDAGQPPESTVAERRPRVFFIMFVHRALRPLVTLYLNAVGFRIS